MSKEAFFNELKECLEGQVSEREYRDSISYYRDYFDEQEKQGKTEEEILKELGDARLIAHSIIDAHGLENEVSHSHNYYDDYTAENYTTYTDTGEEIVNDPQPSPVGNFFGSIGRIIAVVAVLLIAGMALHIVLPIFFVIIAVVFIMGFFMR